MERRDSVDNSKLTETIFARNTEEYITSSTHANEKDLKTIIEWLKPASNMVCLDIATGGGHVAKQLAMHTKHVIALDVTREMLFAAAKHLEDQSNILYCVADAEQLPFLNSQFDIVTCRIAAHHFSNPNQFILEVARVLKPNGKFLLIDNVAPEDTKLDIFYNTFEKIRDKSHVKAHNVSKWRGFIQQNKLQIHKEHTRKKTLPYNEWIARAGLAEDVKKKLEDYLLAAPAAYRSYFQIQMKNNSIDSISIDEWMTLCIKEHPDS